MTACAPGPSPLPPTLTPARARPSSGSLIEGRLARAEGGDRYTDERFHFQVRGPAGWNPRLNFRQPRVRVRFQEPGGGTPCWVAVNVTVSAALNEKALREELAGRGRVFYVDQIEWESSSGDTRPVWVTSVDLEPGLRTEMSYFWMWKGARIEVVGNFPVNRVSSCKPHLDQVMSSVTLSS